MRWIEFPSTDLSVLLVELPKTSAQSSAKRILVAQGAQGHIAELRQAGFAQHKSGNWIYDGTVQQGLFDLQTKFPGSVVTEIPNDVFMANFYRKIAAKSKAPDPVQVQAPNIAPPAIPSEDQTRAIPAPPEQRAENGQGETLFGKLRQYRPQEEIEYEDRIRSARRLGINRQNYTVFEAPNGERFFATGGLNLVNETDSKGNRPGLFLRAFDAESLAACADALQRRIATGESVELEGFRQFASIIYGREVDIEDLALPVLANEVEVAAGRYMAQLGLKTPRDRFDLAQRVQESKPYLSYFYKRTPGLAPLSLPVFVTAQRALGTTVDLEGKKLVIGGPASLGAGLPISADAVIRARNAAEHEQSALSMIALGRDESALLEQGAAWPEHDMAILAPDLGDEPVDFTRPGLELTRGDLAATIEALEARSVMGRTAVILRHTGDERDAELERMREWLGCRYALEGTVDLGDEALSGQDNVGKTRILMVGRARPAVLDVPHEAAMRRKDLGDLTSLWTWTSEVLANRIKIDDYHASMPTLAGRAPGAENRFQRPYPAQSKLSPPSTMVSRLLEGATKAALEQLARNRGDVDQWVGSQLAMSQEQLARVFSPEQIDAIALGIDNAMRGQGFLTADSTGIGKGRILAGLMRWAALSGYEKILFLTERSVNLDDIVRDLRHIETLDDFSVMIMNRGVRILNEDTGEVVMSSALKEDFDEAFENGVWPTGANLILGTYSQFNRNGNIEGVGELPRQRKGEGEEAYADRIDAWRQGRLERGVVSLKSAWLRKVADQNVFLVIDESHNAASGNSNTGANIQEAVNKAGMVVYSSATYAKNAKSMPLYRRLLPSGFDGGRLGDVLRKGGTAMQEAFSEMLVRDRRMITRQHDLSKCTFESIFDDARKERNMALVDQLAPVISGMAFLSGEIDQRIESANDAIAARLAEQIGIEHKAYRAQLSKLQINRTAFGSPLHLTSRLFQMALLADLAADQAIDALKNNQKPIITVENTVQAQMEEIYKEVSEEGGAPRVPDFKQVLHKMLTRLSHVRQVVNKQRVTVDLSIMSPLEMAEDWLANEILATLPENVRDPILAAKNPDPDFGETVMTAIANAVRALRERDQVADLSPEQIEAAQRFFVEVARTASSDAVTMAKAVGQLHGLLPQTTARQIRELRRQIDQFPEMPLSVIDGIRDRVEEEGRRLFEAGEIEKPWVMGEITGRVYECRNGMITRRNARSNNEIKNGFNAGSIDALIINAAGMTGVDLHAGARFADQRQRVMLVLQIMADINRLLQGYGRVNRFDQVNGPIIKHMLLGMPIELLFLARRNAHLRRLSANVNSDREHAAIIGGVPELLNEIGDEVCDRYTSARPDLLRRLGFPVNLAADTMRKNNEANALMGVAEEETESRRSANDILPRVGTMLSVDQQEAFIREITSEFQVALEEHNAAGTNPLKTRELEGKVHLREKHVFDGIEGDDTESVFYKAVYAQNILIEKTVEPLRGAAVATLVERGLAAVSADGLEAWIARLERGKDQFLQQFVDGPLTIEEALTAEQPSIVRMKARTDQLIKVLGELKPGCEITVTQDGAPQECFVVKVSQVSSGRYSNQNSLLGGSYFQPSFYDFEYVMPGDSAPRLGNVGALLKDANFIKSGIQPGLNGSDYRDLLRKFNTRSEGAKLERRVVLTGNLWHGMNHAIEHKLGQIVQWKDESGVRNRGILVAKDKEGLDYLPIRLRFAEMIVDLLNWTPPAGPGNSRQRARGNLVFGSSELSNNGVVINRDQENKGFYNLSMPSEAAIKYGSLYEQPQVREVVKQFRVSEEEKGNRHVRPKLRVPLENILECISKLMDAGVPFYVPSGLRHWCQNWLKTNMSKAIPAPQAEQDVAPDPEAPMPPMHPL